MSGVETDECCRALGAHEKKYKRGDIIMHAGATAENMGVVISGSVTIESVDVWGNCTILSHVGEKGFFAETYALLNDEVMLVDVRANEDCRIMFLNMRRLRPEREDAASWQRKLTANLLTISLHKNLALSRRSFHTAPKTIRRRLLSYLSGMALKTRKTEFDIPFDRSQLADYLNVERTALSKELSKMQRDGIISFKKNRFKLLDTNEKI
ncbi:MAG: Crp/Fnr family transcriptional regulator [Clostridia bacterium]|nr:Crp/Fnr family transcriptional regulator [Clostridia bacterium]